MSFLFPVLSPPASTPRPRRPSQLHSPRLWKPGSLTSPLARSISSFFLWQTTLFARPATVADVLLWRDKKVSTGILGGVIVVWFLFEVCEYHLLAFIFQALIVLLARMFLWSNASSVIKKAPPCIPDIVIPEQPVLQVASALTYEINQAIATPRFIASGKDLKKFLLGCIALGTCD